MDLISLKIQNFGSIGNVTLPLNKPGLILVTGINRDAPNADSNGSGKSLIFEAICWCLWGETVRGLSGDEVVNTKTGKDCVVALTVVEHGTTYVVSRHRLDSASRKPNDLLVFAGGVPLGTTGKLKTMQEVVDQLVGFDFDTFRAMMPGAGIKVANMTDKSIKELLESLLQTEQLSSAYESSRAKLKVLEASIVRHQATAESAKQQIALLENDVQGILQMQQQIEANNQQRREEHESRIKQLIAEVESADSELKKEPELKAQHFDFRTKANSLEAEIETEWLAPLRTSLRLEDEKIKKLSAEQSGLLALAKRIDSDVAKINSVGASCSACQQSVPDGHVESCVASLEAEKSNLKQQVAAISKHVTLIETTKREKEAQTSEVVTAMREHVDQFRMAEKLVVDKLAELDHVKRIKLRAFSDFKREKEALTKLNSQTYDFESSLQIKGEKINELKEVVSQQSIVTKQVEEEIKLCSFWVTGFSPAGLRSFMLDYVTPILNDRAKYYADLLTNGEMEVTFSTKSALKKGDIKDKFSIAVTQTHGSSSYAGSSTGERARADLVIAMALGDLAQFRTAKQLPWRFLDEPFESIDRSGTEAIVKLLNDQKSRYKTVFVVTHKPDFKEMFSQRITIVKQDGLSTLADEADA